MTQQLPHVRQPIAEAGSVTPPWFAWFGRIDAALSAGVITADEATAAIRAICLALGSPDGTPGSIPQNAYLPRTTYVRAGSGLDESGALASGGVELSLEELADSATGALLGITRDAYGRVSGTTDATITDTPGETTVTNGDAVAGPPTIGLADLADSGVGAALVRITRDAKGRVSGTQAATTDHLTEGASNLYFTDARARTAVLSTTITDGDTTHAPDGNAVFDALALKAPLASPTFTGTVTLPTSTTWTNGNMTLLAATADAADTNSVNIGGGGAISATRGAYLRLGGNENGVLAGQAHIVAGVGADVILGASGGGSLRNNIDNVAGCGTAAFRWSNVYGVNFRPGAGAVIWTSGSGTPEGAVTAPVGSLYTRTDGGAGTTLYVKETGVGNTGWVAK